MVALLLVVCRYLFTTKSNKVGQFVSVDFFPRYLPPIVKENPRCNSCEPW